MASLEDFSSTAEWQSQRIRCGLTEQDVAQALVLSIAQVRGIESGSRQAFHNEGFYQRAAARYRAWLTQRLEPDRKSTRLNSSHT